MSAALQSPTSRPDLRGLLQALQLACSSEDGLDNVLNAQQWDALAPYLLPVSLPAGQVLFRQGEPDRTLYLVESGTLSVHYEDEKARLRLAIVGPGSIVGEGGFFSHRPRSATVQAGGPCALWTLTAMRFAELSNRQPAAALQLAMAAGAVLARRMGNRRRRIAVT